jgi:hypothetical protein
MMAPKDPPGFVVRTEAQKAAWDNGFRLERGVERGGWLRYGSTTAPGEIWIAGVPSRGPWLLSINHPGVAAELSTLPPSPLPGQLMCRRLDGSRELVIELAEGRVPEIVVHVLERTLTEADAESPERLRASLDDIGGERRRRSGSLPSV